MGMQRFQDRLKRFASFRIVRDHHRAAGATTDGGTISSRNNKNNNNNNNNNKTNPRSNSFRFTGEKSSFGRQTSSKEQRRRHYFRVTFDESRNIIVPNNKVSWEHDVQATWFTSTELAHMRLATVHAVQELAELDWEGNANNNNNNYATILHDMFHTLVAGDEVSEHTRQMFRQSAVVPSATTVPAESTTTGTSLVEAQRVGLELLLVPALEKELAKRRAQQHKLLHTLQSTSGNKGNPEALAAELSRVCVRSSRPAQRLATLLAQEYQHWDNNNNNP